MPNYQTDWTERQIQTLRKMAECGLPYRFISERLGKSVDAIKHKWAQIRAKDKTEDVA